MTVAPQASGISFVRKRTRVVAGVATAGVMAGLSLVAATPAMAATDADCDVTVDGAALGAAATLQGHLSDDALDVICISGTFALTSTLTYDHSLTLHGLTGAVLDGGGTVGILASTDGAPSLIVENIRFSNGYSSYGGAIAGYAVTAINSVFVDNTAEIEGGAIFGTAVVSQGSVFEGNTANDGGAIFFTESGSVTDSTFTGNSSVYTGGAIAGEIDEALAFVEVESSTFSGNSTGSTGGAIAAYGVGVLNSTFVDNFTDESGAGGAIAGYAGYVEQSTFLDNTTSGGVGESLFGTGFDEIAFGGNIFAGSGTAGQLYADSGLSDEGGNIFSSDESDETSFTPAGSTAFGVTSALLFNGAGLADNGGPTQTVALYAGSPAVDFLPEGLTFIGFDQRGVERDGRSDAGAYQYVSAAPTPALAATGSAPAGWLGGAAALFVAMGALALGLARRTRTR